MVSCSPIRVDSIQRVGRTPWPRSSSPGVVTPLGTGIGSIRADSAPRDRADADALEEPMTAVPEAPETRFETVADGEATHLLHGSVRILGLESFRDARGVLTPITFDDLGFNAARAFVVRAPQ